MDRLCTTGLFIKKEVYDTWNEPMVVVRVVGKLALCTWMVKEHTSTAELPPCKSWVTKNMEV